LAASIKMGHKTYIHNALFGAHIMAIQFGLSSIYFRAQNSLFLPPNHYFKLFGILEYISFNNFGRFLFPDFETFFT